ncbi:hypothetical protein PCANB_000043 [Pneumocystis canis]|nr:hypothetical protein PCK1_000141 [Pneumocystis canis]KAG5439761.1 hypothetical protein PCANB_000043 [Pneumocystis canis]
MTSSAFYNLKSKLKGEPYDFSQLKGKVVLIVNVASLCKFTSQYKELENLYQKYKNSGFEIIAFPCNQFAHQEPGTNEEILQFCTKNYNVTFPIMDKINVNGPSTDAVYQFLKSQKSGFFGLTRIKWNFEKFLIDKNGNVIFRYSSLKNPENLISQIEKLLK